MHRQFFLLILLSTFIYLPQTITAQSSVMSFDGVDDYINLGPNVGNGLRTIEMWFQPEFDITPTLSEPQALIFRSNEAPVNEYDFGLVFNPAAWAPHAGKLHLLFSFGVGNTNHIVYSDSTHWNAGQWYHVAGVYHPNMGMLLFIDGKRQSGNAAFYDSTYTLSKTTTIGTHGADLIRFFAGKIEDVRLSTEALYTVDFMPPCPDIKALPSTKALYNFNGSSSQVVADSSGNGFDASVIGAVHVQDSICPNTTAIDQLLATGQHLTIYPNPFDHFVTFDFSNSITAPLTIQLWNSIGQLVKTETCRSCDQVTFERRSLPAGMYVYSISSKNGIVTSGKIIAE